MSGTYMGGLQTAKTNKEKYGEDYYKKIGAIGGRKITDKPKGFAANNDLARAAGRIGGTVSSRSRRLTQAEKEAALQKLYAQTDKKAENKVKRIFSFIHI